MTNTSLLEIIKHNCDISDARDNGIYSICTLVLKLRNLYKWEHGLEPWQEPDSPVLLDWIAAKEEYWESIHAEPFSDIPINGEGIDPFLLAPINRHLSIDKQVYGAGYGRSMKAVFFMAEILEDRIVEGCPTLILGREKARELSSPFAMLQDGTIYIRKDPMRFFFWDQIQELNPSCRIAMQQALGAYGLMKKGCTLDREKMIAVFDDIVEKELDIFIYHEVGESQENLLDSKVLKGIIGAYPASVLELLARSVKDILADTHPKGLLSHIVAMEKKSSLGFYLSFLDGMRKLLCPELNEASKGFWDTGDWSLLKNAGMACREKNEALALKFRDLKQRLDKGESPEELRVWAEENVLAPLGLQLPDREQRAT
ncbi:MAG: hypothetical protein AMJ60_00735 [Desulfobacterales bacterium SG8_35]|nr:MAG: hypothetical protein AMJ60_00735 [Desulfobacterales bacterium SG8_35]